MRKKIILLILLLTCSTGFAGCINTDNSHSDNATAPGLPQTYNVTGKNFTLAEPKGGQWVRYRVIAPNGSESLVTYNVSAKSGENLTIAVSTASKNMSARATSNKVEARYDHNASSLIKTSSYRNVSVLFDLFFNSSDINTHKIVLQDVNVTYGDLTCIHSRLGALDVWMNEEVPITGVVKCVTENQYMLLDALNKSGNETTAS